MAAIGALRITVGIASPLHREVGATVTDVPVMVGSCLSWLPMSVVRSLGIEPYGEQAFRRADGTVFTRAVAPAILAHERRETFDHVVLALPGDQIRVGFRTLSGWRLELDPGSMRLIDAGPAVAGSAAA